MGMEKAINMLEELAKQGFRINEGDYIGEESYSKKEEYIKNLKVDERIEKLYAEKRN